MSNNNDLHLTDAKLSCCLTDGLERCRIIDDTPPVLKTNHSVVHATGKCRKSDNTAVRFLVEMYLCMAIFENMLTTTNTE